MSNVFVIKKDPEIQKCCRNMFLAFLRTELFDLILDKSLSLTYNLHNTRKLHLIQP